MKRKVLLLNPGYNEPGDYGYHFQPPMGLLKIARYFKNKGVEVEFLDFSLPIRLSDTSVNNKVHNSEAPFIRFVPCGNYSNEGIMKAQRYFGIPERVIRDRIRASKATEVWLGSGLTYYWETVRDIANICREELPSIPILLGGIYATLYPDHAQDHIDYDYLHQGPLSDIDDLLPDYDIDPCKRSIRTIQTGKGCNVSPPCSFCAVVSMDPIFKPIAPDPVFDYIKEEYSKGATHWQIWSSQLLVPPYKFLSLMDKIIRSKMKLSLVASEGVQPSLFTQDISDSMFKAGFQSVSIPMESIDDSEVKDFRKPSDFNDYTKAVTCAQKSGFKKIKSFVMIGVPGQNYDTIIRAIVDCWARDVIPALHQYTPIPGSYDWTRFSQFHGVSPELLHPSLWPGASKDLKVEYLEEIKGITRLGLYRFLSVYDTDKYKLVPEIWDLFYKYCKMYGLKPAGYKPLAYPGYSSIWTDKYLNVNN